MTNNPRFILPVLMFLSAALAWGCTRPTTAVSASDDSKSKALEARVASLSAEEFYYLARMAMVKDERHFDRFDRVFAEHFEGAQKLFEKLMAELPPMLLFT